MARQIVTERDVARAAPEAGPGPGPLADMGGMMEGAPAPPPPESGGAEVDGYFDRLMKYIPTEIVTLYAALATMITAAQPVGGVEESVIRAGLPWFVFLVCLFLTPVHLMYLGVTKRKQLTLSTLCFLVWAVALNQGPFESLDPLVGAIVLPLFSFTLPYWDWDAKLSKFTAPGEGEAEGPV